MEVGDFFRTSRILKLLDNLHDEIVTASKANGVDHNLVKAIIVEEQSHVLLGESFWEENLGIGSTVGLGQITVGKHGFSREQLLDAKTNIRAIATHLKSLLQQPLILPGAPVASLATKYNCGTCRSITAYGRRVVSYYYQVRD